MRPVAIVTDSTHYTAHELIVAAGVHEVSLYVRDGASTRRESEITDYDAFYERLRTEADPPATVDGRLRRRVGAAAGRRLRHRLGPPLGRDLGHRRSRRAGQGTAR